MRACCDVRVITKRPRDARTLRHVGLYGIVLLLPGGVT